MSTKKAVLNIQTTINKKLTFSLVEDYGGVELRVSDGRETYSLFTFGTDGVTSKWGEIPIELGLKVNKDGELITS